MPEACSEKGLQCSCTLGLIERRSFFFFRRDGTFCYCYYFTFNGMEPKNRVIFLTMTRAGKAAFRAQLINVRPCGPRKDELCLSSGG